MLNEQRLGGQVDFESDDRGSTAVYGQHVQINQPEIWTKTGFRWDDVHNLSFYFSGFHQNQDSYFGMVNYDAKQTYLVTIYDPKKDLKKKREKSIFEKTLS